MKSKTVACPPDEDRVLIHAQSTIRYKLSPLGQCLVANTLITRTFEARTRFTPTDVLKKIRLSDRRKDKP